MQPAAAIKTEEMQSNAKLNPLTMEVILACSNNGVIMQYTNKNCVSAIKTKFGQRINLTKAIISFNQKNYATK